MTFFFRDIAYVQFGVKGDCDVKFADTDWYVILLLFVHNNIVIRVPYIRVPREVELNYFGSG